MSEYIAIERVTNPALIKKIEEEVSERNGFTNLVMTKEEMADADEAADGGGS